MRQVFNDDGTLTSLEPTSIPDEIVPGRRQTFEVNQRIDCAQDPARFFPRVHLQVFVFCFSKCY